MNTFLKTYRLALTPLSPIHIGCGEDFEPTNYVIDEGILYSFDPSRATLTDLQKSKLSQAIHRVSLQEIQRFFKDNAKTFQAQADALIPVSSGVARTYEQRVGRAANIEASGNIVFNQLFIERTMHTGTRSLPYIPGSSFKGALRTSWLDDLNAERMPRDVEYKYSGEAKSSTRMETSLLDGDFQTSPLRLLKVSDWMPPAHQDMDRRVVFAVNLKKKRILDSNGLEKQGGGPTTRKECILPGQYRLFESSVTLPSLQAHLGKTDHQGKPLTPAAKQVIDFQKLALACNRYHLSRLRRELAVLEGRGFVNPEWKTAIERLLAGDFGQRLKTGAAFLIRLGRYGGAESKTLSGESVASIKIMGARGQPPTFESISKTVWLAAEDETTHKHLLPFGWAVVEIDPIEDLPDLQAWCATQVQNRPGPDMAALRARLAAEKAAAQQQKAEQIAQAAAREATKQAELLVTARRATALADMTAQTREIEELRDKCEEWIKQLPPHGNFKKQAADPSKGGLYQDAARLVKTALDSTDWSATDRAALAEMLAQCLPLVITPWDAKDQRKKLKLSALRGL